MEIGLFHVTGPEAGRGAGWGALESRRGPWAGGFWVLRVPCRVQVVFQDTQQWDLAATLSVFLLTDSFCPQSLGWLCCGPGPRGAKPTPLSSCYLLCPCLTGPGQGSLRSAVDWLWHLTPWLSVQCPLGDLFLQSYEILY